MSASQHRLPEGLRPALDLRVSPTDPWRALHYLELVLLLEEMGRLLDEATPLAADDLRAWEARVVRLLRGPEIDLFLAAPQGAEEFEAGALPEQRYRNLKRILLARKGLRPDGA